MCIRDRHEAVNERIFGMEAQMNKINHPTDSTLLVPIVELLRANKADLPTNLSLRKRAAQGRTAYFSNNTARTGAKLRRCTGVAPSFCKAARWTGVG